MFTGIIEEIGTVKKVTRKGEFLSLEINASVVTKGTKVGDSIAVNGVCLTVTDLGTKDFFADVMQETYNATTISKLSVGGKVNLERAMTENTRLGGHMVAGHVDCMGSVTKKKFEHNTYLFTVQVPLDLMKFIAVKGSVAIDGISLTVVSKTEKEFKVGIIPHTMHHTTLEAKNPGDTVNVEVDLLARYVVNYLDTQEKSKSFDWGSLAKEGI